MIGFVAAGKLRRFRRKAVHRSPCVTPPGSRGASWGEDGNIVAALGSNGGLSLVPEAGGPPKPLTKLLPGWASHRWPQILPGNKAVLFTAASTIASFEDATLTVASLETGQYDEPETPRIFRPLSALRGSTGHLIYRRSGAVFRRALRSGTAWRFAEIPPRCWMTSPRM
jgi:serine/threonine-protein kinase